MGRKETGDRKQETGDRCCCHRKRAVRQGRGPLSHRTPKGYSDFSLSPVLCPLSPMPCSLTWLGHASWQLKTQQHTLLIDPFLDDSPTAPVKAKDVQADFILVSHGHFDHIADAAKIANRTGATIVSNYEITTWLT